MAATVVVGTQWGDEGKGKLVDYLAQNAEVVVRFNGGDNAGHTIVNDLGTFKLRLVPGGVFNPAAVCVIGSGTIVNPDALLAELAALEARGVPTNGVRVSRRAHVVLPHHLRLEGARERARGVAAQGSTGRGVAPAYADKAARIGIRVGDLGADRWLDDRLREQAAAHDPLLMAVGEPRLDVGALGALCRRWADLLAERVVDDAECVLAALAAGQPVIAEGQLGALRDLDWGIYPYSTSSTTLAGGCCAGAGIPPRYVGRVIGVTKAYTSAVGGGPVAAELDDAMGGRIRETGLEFGTATGRARRCGWFDAVATRYGAMITGADELALTKLDVLDGFDPVRVCVGYRYHGRELHTFPDAACLADVEPRYEDAPGWRTPTAGVRRWEELPPAARDYVRRVDALVGGPVTGIGTGTHRQDLVSRG